MDFLLNKCTLHVLNKDILINCQPFSCGHHDLDDFFINESCLYSDQLLGKTYCFSLDEDPSIIVCAFTVSNDSIKTDTLPNNRKKKLIKDIPRPKHMRRYPAVLIGRLGINNQFKRRGIGTELMDFIKSWFINKNNKTGCRFIVVDSYNEEAPKDYYCKNKFEYLFYTEEDEAERMGVENIALKTRLMYFDLIGLC